MIFTVSDTSIKKGVDLHNIGHVNTERSWSSQYRTRQPTNACILITLVSTSLTQWSDPDTDVPISRSTGTSRQCGGHWAVVHVFSTVSAHRSCLSNVLMVNVPMIWRAGERERTGRGGGGGGVSISPEKGWSSSEQTLRVWR